MVEYRGGVSLRRWESKAEVAFWCKNGEIGKMRGKRKSMIPRVLSTSSDRLSDRNRLKMK